MERHLFDVGLYTLAEVDRLTGVPVPKLSRWLGRLGTQEHAGRPLWPVQTLFTEGRVIVGFLDVMQIRVLRAFLDYGLTLQRMAEVIGAARDAFDLTHPLASRQFRAEGAEILRRVGEAAPAGPVRDRLLDLHRVPNRFSGILDPVLRDVDFREDGLPLLWWPAGREGGVVIDPRRAFGAPIDAESSVPTRILAQDAARSGVEATARSYLVSAAAVRRSMAYDKALEVRATCPS